MIGSIVGSSNLLGAAMPLVRDLAPCPMSSNVTVKKNSKMQVIFE
jgi:hypothetical protein